MSVYVDAVLLALCSGSKVLVTCFNKTVGPNVTKKHIGMDGRLVPDFLNRVNCKLLPRGGSTYTTHLNLSMYNYNYAIYASIDAL